MGHRATTISFAIVIVACAAIWLFFRNTAQEPEEQDQAGTVQTPETIEETGETTTPTTPADDTDEPFIEPEQPETTTPIAAGTSSLAVRVIERGGGRPEALAIALVPLIGRDEVVYRQLPDRGAQLDELAPGRYLACILTGSSPATLVEPASGATRAVRLMTLRPGQVEVLAARLGPRVSLSGTVRDFNDYPVAGAVVRVRPLTSPYVVAELPEWLERTAMTNTAGEFLIEGAPAGDLVVEVTKQGSARARRTVKADAADELIMHLVLAPGHEAFGTVSTQDGLPIPGASVLWLDRENQPITTMITDEQGRYELGSLPASGPYTLFFLAQQYAYTMISHAGLTLVDDKITHVPFLDVGDLGNTVLAPEQTIGGTALYSDETPVVGAQVTVREADGSQLLTVLDTSTRPDGRFMIRHLRNEPYEVTVVDISTGKTASMTLPAGSRDARIVLSTGYKLTGLITDARTRRPLAGAFVTAGGSVATSGLDGGYQLWLPEDVGRLDVSAGADGYETRTEKDVRLRGAETIVDLALVPAPVARCWLVDAEEQTPVAGAPVRWRLDDEPFARRSLRSSLEGEIAFDGAALTDRIHLEVLDARYAPVIEDVTLSELDGERIEMTPGTTIRGRVLNTAGEPVVGADVYVGEGYLSFNDPFVKRVHAGEEGRYEMTGMPEGLFQITAAHADYLTTQSFPVDTRRRSEIDDVDIVMDAGVTITGTVLDEDGDPIQGAAVQGWGDFNYDPVEPSYRRSTTTDDDGRFVLGRLRRTESGAITISASATGYATTTGSVTVGRDEDEAEDEVVITLRAEAAIRGVAVTTEGTPIGAVSVYVKVNDLVSHIVQTGAEGRFAIDALLPGSYALIFTRPGFLYRALAVQVEGGSDPAEVRAVLERGAVLSGRVVNSFTGEPVPIFGGTIATPDRMRSYRLYVTGDGRFTTDTVPDGDYVVTIHSKNMRTTTVEGVAVREHLGPPDLTVRLEPAPN